jgi:hypothetical protein
VLVGAGHLAKDACGFRLTSRGRALARAFAFIKRALVSIPCFNEEQNVGATVSSVRPAMGQRDDYDIILVNDASTDRPWSGCRRWRPPIPASGFSTTHQIAVWKTILLLLITSVQRRRRWTAGEEGAARSGVAGA